MLNKILKNEQLIYTARDSRIGSAGVGQPLNLNPPASLKLIQVGLQRPHPKNDAFSGTPEGLRRQQSLIQIQGASLAYSDF